MVELGVVEKFFMESIKKLVNFSLSPEYLIEGSDINPERVDLLALCGEERGILKTPVNGDSTLVLRYKEAEGVLLSLITEPEILEITQFQGASGKAGYRLTSQLKLPRLFADQVKTIATSEQACFRRICMPPIEKIEGLLESGSEIACQRYKSLAAILGMAYSKEEMLYVKDIKRD